MDSLTQEQMQLFHDAMNPDQFAKNLINQKIKDYGGDSQ